MLKLFRAFFKIEESIFSSFSRSEWILIRILFLLIGSKSFFHGSKLAKDERIMNLFLGELIANGSEG